MVYDDLRRLAARRLRHEAKNSLMFQPTGLVHEVYVRLTESEAEAGWDSREHFFAAAAESMRRILIDHARRQRCDKRGGNYKRVHIRCDQIRTVNRPNQPQLLLMLDETLTRLSARHERKARLASLRIFAGLTIGEAADVLGVSVATAERDWAFARAWLRCEMTTHEDPSLPSQRAA